MRRLLKGLIERTDYPDLELVVVDNASTDESLSLMRTIEAPFPISILANAHNESFSDACNQGAELAAGELLLFLNNDAEPFEPGWLRELVSCLHGSPAGAVGPTLLEPGDGAAGSAGYLVQQRGLRARQEGDLLVPAFRDHHVDPLGEGLGNDIEVIAVAAACLLIGRGTFEEAGGFTPGYWYGPEDVDLCLKLRERGGSVCSSGRSVLIHPPNSTLSRIDTELRREWVRGNRILFGELWGPRLRREYELDRLRGGGLWAEPGPAGGSSWGSTAAEVEELGFCLKSAAARDGEQAAASLEALAAALRRRGRRALALRGAEVDRPDSLDYDVAVHLAGPCRYAPKRAQLNLLWDIGGAAVSTATERSRYDLSLSGDPAGSPESADRLAEQLISASSRLAEASGFRTRIEPHSYPIGAPDDPN